MKKIMIMVAAFGLLVACGGNSEKKEKTIADQYNEWMEKISNGGENYSKYVDEYDKWYDSLTDEQKKEIKAAEEEAEKKFQEEMDQFDEEMKAVQEMGYDF